VQNWVNGTEKTTYVGISARFGLVLPKEASETQKHFAVLADPSNCCSNSSSEVPFYLFYLLFPSKDAVELYKSSVNAAEEFCCVSKEGRLCLHH
jgi:hypothetical protein